MPIPSEFTTSAKSGSGVAASIVLPAPAPNVAWVIKHIHAHMQIGTTGAAGGPFAVDVIVLDGSTQIFDYRLDNPGGSEVDSSIDQDVTIPCTPGNAVTIQFTASSAGIQQGLVITATVQ